METDRSIYAMCSYFKFTAYLKGMETTGDPSSMVPPGRFTAYLKGMETCRNRRDDAGSKGSQPT